MIVEHGLRGLHASPSSENADGAPPFFPSKAPLQFWRILCGSLLSQLALLAQP